MHIRFSAAASILSLTAAALAPAPAAAQTAPAASPPAPPAERGQTLTVTGTRPQVIDAPDRLSFNVANDLGAQTGSLADALRNVPGVEVDLEGKVSLRGDPGVTILVDGRPSGQLRGEGRGDALLSMPANSIERVEVITNPSAAMSPEGSGGVINLITRKQRQAGTTGTVRANAGLEGRGSVSLSVARSRPGLTISGEAAYRRFTNEIIVTQDRERFLAGGGVLASRQEQFHDNVAQGANARFGVEYDLDKTNRVTGEISYRRNQLNSDRDERFIGNAAEAGFTRFNEQEMQQRILGLRSSWRKTLPGKDHASTRSLARAIGVFSQAVKHSSTPTRREAGMAVDSVITLANLLRRLEQQI